MQQPKITIKPGGKVCLFLPGKEDHKQIRCLGKLIGDVFHCERNPNHLFRAFGGSFGFNFDLFRRGGFSNVAVHLPDGTVLCTTREHVLLNGKMLHFQKNKLEKQIFLALSEFGMGKARKSDKAAASHLSQIQRVRQNQTSLF